MPNNWLDALYNQLILRDVFGKIGPGLLVIFSIMISCQTAGWIDQWAVATQAGIASQQGSVTASGTPTQPSSAAPSATGSSATPAQPAPATPPGLVALIESFSWEMSIALLVFAWLMGVGVQGFGSLIFLFWTYPTVWPGRKRLLDAHTAKFRKRNDYQRFKLQHERTIVIKEATGNAFLALLIAAVLVTWVYYIKWKQMPWDKNEIFIPFYGLTLALILGFAKMHFSNVRRQYDFMQTVIGQKDSLAWPSASLPHPEA